MIKRKQIAGWGWSCTSIGSWNQESYKVVLASDSAGSSLSDSVFLHFSTMLPFFLASLSGRLSPLGKPLQLQAYYPYGRSHNGKGGLLFSLVPLEVIGWTDQMPHLIPELDVEWSSAGGQPKLSVHKVNFFADVAQITLACTARSWEE